MSSSIRTEVGIKDPGDCPVARMSESNGTTVTNVVRSAAVEQGGTSVEEFALDVPVPTEHDDVERVFEADSQTVYRYERDQPRRCVCACIERHGCPVFDLRARSGTLFVSFHAPDVDKVQEIIDDLHGAFDGVQVRRMVQRDEQTERDFALVDRSRLTERQREVLETGYEMGYFDHPKQANGGEVADSLGISPSTFSEHLAAAQKKILDTLLES
jgi:predicted DNA binding protein